MCFQLLITIQVFTEKMGLEAGWNCHISLLSEEGGSSSSTSPNTLTAVSRQHSDTSAKSSSHIQDCQVNMEACNVRVSWSDVVKEDKMDASTADQNRKSVTIEMGNISHDSTDGCQVEDDVEEVDAETKDENSNDDDVDPDLPQIEKKKVGRTSSKEADDIDSKNMNLDTSIKSSEAESLLQPEIQKSSSSEDVGASLRRRHVSETQTFSDGTDVDTISHYTESDTTGGFDISNRVSNE